MDDLLAWLLATAASCNIKKNGLVDSSHRTFSQVGSWVKMADNVEKEVSSELQQELNTKETSVLHL